MFILVFLAINLVLSRLATESFASPGASTPGAFPLESELPAVLQRNHTSYPALQRLQARVEESERQGFPGTGADLLLLAAGFLQNEPRMLQEYLRMHGEAVPDAVRAHMTTGLAVLLEEASKRNLQQDWVVLAPSLAGEWRSQQSEKTPCRLYANGKDLGLLSGARLRVVPDVPQRLHVTCGAHFHIASTVVPIHSSADVEAPLSPANATRFENGKASPSRAEPHTLGSTTQEADPTGHEGSGADSRARIALTAHLLRVGGRPREAALHNLGLVDGLFLRGGVRYTSDGWFLGLSATSARQKLTRARADAPNTAQHTVQAYVVEAGLVWPLSGAFSVPISAGLWRWRCDTRPCGFFKKDPGLTLSAGPAVELPFGHGIGVELAMAPGVVVGANPEPFLDFGVQVRREW